MVFAKNRDYLDNLKPVLSEGMQGLKESFSSLVATTDRSSPERSDENLLEHIETFATMEFLDEFREPVHSWASTLDTGQSETFSSLVTDTISSDGSASGVASDTYKYFPTCVYEDDCTNLYRYIEKKRWKDIVRFLDTGKWWGISFFPDYISPKDQAVTYVVSMQGFDLNWKRLPIHLAIENDAPFSVLQRLIDIDPEMVTAADHEGNLPLHLALCSHTSDESLAYILSRYQGGVFGKNRAGVTPLDRACDVCREHWLLSRAIALRTVFERGPLRSMPAKSTELWCDYQRDCSPLYKVIELQDWESIAFFLQEGRWSELDTCLSTRFLCGSSNQATGPAEQVRTLVRHKNKRGQIVFSRLPLHLAVMLHAPPFVIRKLLEIYPESAKVRDDQGMFPLHIAFSYGLDYDVLALLLLRAPSICSASDRAFHDPIDSALQGDCPALGVVLRMFIDASRLKSQIADVGQLESTNSITAESVKSNPSLMIDDRLYNLFLCANCGTR